MALLDRIMRRQQGAPQEAVPGVLPGVGQMLPEQGAMPGRGVVFEERGEEAEQPSVITKERLSEAMQTLRKYKAGKANLERRIIENEQWWKLRHWDHIPEKGTTALKTKSAWLVNVILSKHADAMDALPEPNCLPREMSDQGQAQMLSSVVPVVLQQNDFELTWSDNWWKKLKAGLAIYGVFWDKEKLGGLGDITIRRIDPLNLFWEPGIDDIQKSRNVFHVELADNEALEEQYPQLKGKLGAKTFTAAKYMYDDQVDTSEKSAVIDWYYHKDVGGRKTLQYVKFVNDTVLYATEDDVVDPAQYLGRGDGLPQADALAMTGGGGFGATPQQGAMGGAPGQEMPGAPTPPEPLRGGSMAERGLYDHGLFPFFFDVLFPEEGTPAGLGYIDVCKDAQRQIDLMNNAIVANCVAAATPRWLKRGEDGINEEEYADWTRPFVHVQGSIEENAIKQIQVNQLSGNYLNILISKIDELKETSGNRDVNNGGAPSGVTAASAIAAMQEQSGKLSRDQIQNSYRCYRNVVYCVIELIRQFYDAPRQFRITGPQGAEFVSMSNQGMQPQHQGFDANGEDMGYRVPQYDIEVTAQKQTAYSKLSYNELAIQFFQIGFFNPQLSDQALAAIEMMDFKGKEELRQRIAANGTLYQQLQAALQQNAMLMQMLGAAGAPPPGAAAGAQPMPSGGGEPVKLPETNSQGGIQKKENAIVTRARSNANAATQPR